MKEIGSPTGLEIGEKKRELKQVMDKFSSISRRGSVQSDEFPRAVWTE